MTTKNERIDYTNAIIGVAFCVFMSIGIIATALTDTHQPCKPAVVGKQ